MLIKRDNQKIIKREVYLDVLRVVAMFAVIFKATPHHWIFQKRKVTNHQKGQTWMTTCSGGETMRISS